MNHLVEKVKDALVKQDHHRYMVYSENAIIEANSEKKLMKILLHQFPPGIYDDEFWCSLIDKNRILAEFTQALRKSFIETPHIKGESNTRPFAFEKYIRRESEIEYIWDYVKDNYIQMTKRLGDFFDQMIETEKITLKNFPNSLLSIGHGDHEDRIPFFRRLSDMKVVRNC